MSGWRVARSLIQLRTEVDKRWPNRKKDSDGTIGDASHQSRTSDHDPDASGVVHAMDITHDPASGCDSYALADWFLKAQDPRVKYIISNRKIASGTGQGHPPWEWRKYTGANPHDHHVHISVKSGNGDDTHEWGVAEAKLVLGIEDHPKPVPRTLKPGDTGAEVQALQQKLGIAIDGMYGPKMKTAILAFQAIHKLVPDGVVGPQTWNVLNHTGEVA